MLAAYGFLSLWRFWSECFTLAWQHQKYLKVILLTLFPYFFWQIDISRTNRTENEYVPNCSKISLQFLKLSSIFGNFNIMLLKDFTLVPWDDLRCMASTILASSFVSGTEAFLGDSAFPTTPPIASYCTTKMGSRTNFNYTVNHVTKWRF